MYLGAGLVSEHSRSYPDGLSGRLVGEGAILCQVSDRKSGFWTPSGQRHDWYIGGECSEVIGLGETGLGDSSGGGRGRLDCSRGIEEGVAPCVCSRA